MLPALKTLAIWGGGALAATIGIQKLTGMDAATHGEEFNQWLEENHPGTDFNQWVEQNRPAINAAYTDFYRSTVGPLSQQEGNRLSNSMLWIGDGGSATIESFRLNQEQQARLPKTTQPSSQPLDPSKVMVTWNPDAQNKKSTFTTTLKWQQNALKRQARENE